MEFEKAIFRVYERSMEGVLLEEERAAAEPSNAFVSALKRPCLIMQIFAFSTSAFMLFSLVVLHSAYVGAPGCLARELLVFNATTNRTAPRVFAEDEVLYIRVSPSLLRSSGSSLRPLSDDDDTANAPLNPTSQSLRRHHTPHNTLSLSALSQSLTRTLSSRSQRLAHSLLLSTESLTESSANVTQPHNDSLPFTPFDFDYQLTFSTAVTLLSQRDRAAHTFRSYNVTLSEDEDGHCLGGALARALLPLGGLDLVVLNNAVQAARQPPPHNHRDKRDKRERSRGILITRQGSVFAWKPSTFGGNPSIFEDFPQWLYTKISTLFVSLSAFFLLSTSTALLVRVLLTSGVTLVFPLLYLLQLMGMPPVNMRILSISYPWIGLPLLALRQRNQSIVPLLLAHAVRVLLYYLLYVGAQSLCVEVLYAPVAADFGAAQVWLFACMMLWEYFALLYVRAVSSIRLFPRTTLCVFVVYHAYCLAYPTGFHVLAMCAMLFAVFGVMIVCVRVFELKAFRQGLVSADQPRMLYPSLPWPMWRADLAPEYTLFMPVTQRSSSVYQGSVPPPPGTQPPPPTEGAADAAPQGDRDFELRPLSGQTETATPPTQPAQPPQTSFFSRLWAATDYRSIERRGDYAALSVSSDSAHGQP